MNRTLRERKSNFRVFIFFGTALSVVLLLSCRTAYHATAAPDSKSPLRPQAADETEKKKQKKNGKTLQDQVAALSARIREKMNRYKRSVPPGQLPDASGSLRETEVALAGVQAAKAEDYLRGDRPMADEDAEKALRNARRLLNRKTPEHPPRLVKQGDLVENAYIAQNDNSPQPYFVYRPDSYSRDKDFPLMVCLHGWVPSISRISPSLVPSFLPDIADEHDVILVVPHGRTNTDFQYPGELDVLRVIKEMRKFYPINENRIYLTGMSMGGAGTWQIGMHHPDLFAGIAPINGQTSWFGFWHEQFDFPPRKKLPAFLERLFAAFNPLDLAVNLQCLYSYAQQAKDGFVGAEQLRTFHQKLKKHDIALNIDASPLGHYIYWQESCWQSIFTKLLKRTRTKEPASFRYVTYSPRYSGAYWADIIRFSSWKKRPARMQMQHVGQSEFIAKTSHVAALKLHPPKKWIGTNNRITLHWNGRNYRKKLDADGSAVFTKSRKQTAETAHDEQKLLKNRNVCGPLSDIFHFPMTAVRGTSGNDADDEKNAQLARKFRKDWERYAEGQIPLVKDKEVDEKMIQERNLILFGLPETNRVVKRIADKLPIELSKKQIVLPDGHTYRNDELGLIMIYPNPLNPDRYVVIYQGIHWGEDCSKNHVFDRIPDFIIYTEESLSPLGINRYRAAGFFNNRWQYDPDLTEFRELQKTE